MQFDMKALDRSSRYKIIGSCITPRPIAWVTSMSAGGALNIAPFSFFNAMGDNPPVMALGMVAHPENRLKDTAANIRETGEFVINLVSEEDAQAMNFTAIDAPDDVDESTLVDLALSPSIAVRPPRIASAPANFECKTLHFIDTGPHQVVILAEVIGAHIPDRYILDPDRILIDVPAMNLIARLHGAGWYTRQTDTFEMLRPQWKKFASKDLKNATQD